MKNQFVFINCDSGRLLINRFHVMVASLKSNILEVTWTHGHGDSFVFGNLNDAREALQLIRDGV